MFQYKPMARDFIPKIKGYSLSDFHDYDSCVFKFLVKHDLDKKYEIGKGSAQMALGVLLDKTIKNIHKRPAYDYPLKRLLKGVRFSAEEIKKEEQSKPRPNFNTATVEFLSEDVILAAEQVLQNYYQQIEGKFKQKISDIGFYQTILDIDGDKYKIWGGPDTLEMGEDGMPEIVDYKSRQDIAKGKQNMDMDLMPKLYTLLLSGDLLRKGFKKARFKVVFWQDPKDQSFAREFNLEDLSEVEELFKEKIKAILGSKIITFCMLPYCEACNSEKSEEYVAELENMGYSLG